MTGVSAYVRANARRFVRELAELVAFPSVSSTPSPALAACAHWLVAQLRRLGSRDARLVATAGQPVVVGSIGHDPRRPTVLVYSHYDVQPASPSWRPFEPRVVNGYLIGRGASDAKGQLFAHLKAIEVTRALVGELPANVVFAIEGEEEIGSPHLAPVVERIAADVAVVSDTPVLGIDRPSITYSLRGELYLHVGVRGRAGDRHSGTFGGGLVNPLGALVAALARLHDRRGAVTVPGFTDDVVPASQLERRFMRAAGPSDRDIALGAELAGEPGFTPYERTTIRPSIELAGLSGGYTGVGIKGVIPASATAKLDVRLVPHQDPDRVHRQIYRRLARALPPGLELETRELARATPIVLPRSHPAMQAAARAYRRGFGVDATFVRAGGSIPVVSTLAHLPTVLMGYALPDDGAHGPNERYSLAMLGRAIATAAAFLEEIAR